MYASPPADDPVNSPRRPTVLYVESDVILRQATAEALRAARFTVVEAATASEALAVVQSSVSIDVLLTELQSPGAVDGVRLTQEARTGRPNLIVVIASSQTPGWPFQRTIDAFFGKPYDLGRVVNRIRGLLKGDGE